MENMPLVSILTPTYNHAKYLAECIESVLNQTYPAWEMIILNDGSTDNTSAIAREYAEKDSRIRVFDQQNIGIFRLVETYNKGVRLASGKFLAILEGDDWWAPDKLRLQVEAMEKNPGAILCWGMARCVNATRSEAYYSSPLLNDPEASWFNNEPVGSILNIFLFRNCIPALTILVTREAIVQAGGFRQVHHLPLVDLPTLYILATSGRFVFLPEVLGDWRLYANQVTKTYPAEMTEGFFRLASEFLEINKGKFNLSADQQLLKRYYSRRMVIAWARSGRFRLVRKEFAAARKDYAKAIFRYGLAEPVWKLRAITGWVFSLFKLDIEGLAKMLGKAHYSGD